jgi:hypothetical protein
MTATLREDAPLNDPQGREKPKGMKKYEKPCMCEQHKGQVLPWWEFHNKTIAPDGMTLYCRDYYKGRGYVRDIAQNQSHPLTVSRIEWLRAHHYFKMLAELGELNELDAAVADADNEVPMRDAEPSRIRTEDLVLPDDDPHSDDRMLDMSPRQTPLLDLREMTSFADLQIEPIEDMLAANEFAPVPRPLSLQLQSIARVIGTMAQDLAAIENHENTAQTTVVHLQEQLAGVTSQLRNAEKKIEQNKREHDQILLDAQSEWDAKVALIREYYALLRSVGVVIPTKYEL